MKSATVDALDRRLLQALQIDGRASFSRIAAVLGVSDQTVARRYRRLREFGGLRVLGVPDGTRLGHSSWFVRLTCTPDAAEPLASALARRGDTSWVGLASGGTEVVCTMRARSRGEHASPLFARLQRTPRVVSVSAHLLLHTFYGESMGWFTKFDVLDAAEARALCPPQVEPGGGPVVLEPVDEALIAVLAVDGRATIAELQAATNLSESAAKRRLDQLLRSGALYIDVQCDSRLFGYGLHAQLWLTVAPAALSTVGEALATHPEVAFATAITGPSNVLAVAIFRETGDLYHYLNERIGPLAGVQRVETVPVLRQIKQLAA